jgi:hypothetical protein
VGSGGTAGDHSLAGEAGASVAGQGGDAGAGGRGGRGGSGGKAGAGAGGGSGGDAGGAAGESGEGGAAAGGAGAGGTTAGTSGKAGAGGAGASAGASTAGTAGEGGVPTCDGAPGPGCACIKVTLDGDDQAALASVGAEPFGSVQAAMDFAEAHPAVATNVCVAAGAACGATGAFTYDAGDGAGLTLRNGVSVYGGYESAGWTRCSDSTTTLAPGAAGLGLVFGSDVSQPTVLDGFDVSGNVAGEFAAVVADGATGGRLQSVRVAMTAASGRAVGVLAVNGATFTLADVRVSGESGAQETTGVRASGASVSILQSVVQVSGATRVVAVELSDAPGSSVQGSTLSAQGTDASTNETVSALGITGDVEGTTVSGSSLFAYGPAYALSGVSVQSCDGDLSIESNTIGADNPTTGYVTGQPTTYGLQVSGDCAALVEGNDVESVGGNGIVNTALDCRAPCTVLDNSTVRVDKTGQQVAGGQGLATGISCENCVEIRDNVVLGLVNPTGNHRTTLYEATGISVRGATLVAHNRVTGGCGAIAIGVEAGGGSRLENNLILGRPVDSTACGGPLNATYARYSYGVRALSGVELHSNRVVAGDGELESIGVTTLDAGTTAILRNNQLVGYFAALVGASSASLFGALENNALEGGVRTGGPMSQTFATAPEINALPGASGNLVGPCNGTPYAPDFHLVGASPCIDAGTSTAAPAKDWDGEARDASPDIGPDEYSTLHDVCYGVTCGGHGRCVPLAGLWCQCDAGYAPAPDAPLECIVDHCSVSGACDPLTFCTNARDGRTCSACPSGYTGTGESGCVDIDECQTANGGCDPLTTCTNVPGRRTCGPCPPNHVGTGETGCTPSDTCSPNPCQRGAACTPGTSTFTCDCQPGITGATCNRTFAELALGSTYFCGLRDDASVRCDNQQVVNNQVLSGTFLAVASDTAHACAIRTDGTMTCFGANGSGQATAPSGTFVALDVTHSRTCAVRTDGTLTCFGLAFIGNAVPPSGTFLDVVASSNFSCALATDRSVVCFGWDTAGETVAPAGPFEQVSVGDDFGCGLRDDGTVTCWGSTSFAQTTVPSATLQQISSAGHATCGVRTDGGLTCWGNVPTGTIPTGTFRSVAVMKDQNSGMENACAIRTDDVVLCWGSRILKVPKGAP